MNQAIDQNKILEALIQKKMEGDKEDSNMSRLKQLVSARENTALNANVLDQRNDDIETKHTVGLVDDLTGSRISQRLTPSKAPMDRLQEAINNRRMMPKENDGLPSLLDLMEKQRREEGEQRRQQKDADQFKKGAWEKMYKEVEKPHNDYLEKTEMISKLRENIGAGTVGRLGAITNGVARFVNGEKGPLSDGDVRRSMPASTQQYWSTVEAFIQSNPNQPLPVELVKDLQRQVDIAENAMKQKYNSELETKKKFFDHAVTEGVAGYRSLGKEGVNKLFQQAGYDSAWRKNLEPSPKQENMDMVIPDNIPSEDREEYMELMQLRKEFGGK